MAIGGISGLALKNATFLSKKMVKFEFGNVVLVSCLLQYTL
jgi:hypothetical protein